MVASNTESNGDMVYAEWSRERLIQRIAGLEEQLKHSRADDDPKAPEPKQKRQFDPSKYSTRFIALKLAYLGQNYNGFEYAAGTKTKLPTIEEMLWRALVKTRLISPPGSENPEGGKLSWEGCEYAKCGRTDVGVSAFGQVISLRVRSNRSLIHDTNEGTAATQGEEATQKSKEAGILEQDPAVPDEAVAGDSPSLEPSQEPPPFHDVDDEIPYPQALNRVLPPDIRVYAWCPNPPPDFSARFSCRERQYRYFFTQPAFAPTPGHAGLLRGPPVRSKGGERLREGWLDIGAMQQAAAKFVGLHDFRNFCKIDPSKQLQSFDRRITLSEVRALPPSASPAGYVSEAPFTRRGSGAWLDDTMHRNASPFLVYEFVLHGSAFLWHQVRHMVAVLFLIGQGLEQPSLIDKLLDVRSYPRRPIYEMADDAPLVLWDCVFPATDSDFRKENVTHVDNLRWIYVDDDARNMNPERRETALGRFGHMGVVSSVWANWRKRKMDEILAGSLLNEVARRGRKPGEGIQSGHGSGVETTSQKLFTGGEASKLAGRYVPVLERPRAETVEALNAKWLVRKAAADKAKDSKTAAVSKEAESEGTGTGRVIED